ncbi:MAG: hypothetical protein AABY15_07045 [Nanoarchaeota archaeon]
MSSFDEMLIIRREWIEKNIPLNYSDFDSDIQYFQHKIDRWELEISLLEFDERHYMRVGDREDMRPFPGSTHRTHLMKAYNNIIKLCIMKIIKKHCV